MTLQIGIQRPARAHWQHTGMDQAMETWVLQSSLGAGRGDKDGLYVTDVAGTCESQPGGGWGGRNNGWGVASGDLSELAPRADS